MPTKIIAESAGPHVSTINGSMEHNVSLMPALARLPTPAPSKIALIAKEQPPPHSVRHAQPSHPNIISILPRASAQPALLNTDPSAQPAALLNASLALEQTSWPTISNPASTETVKNKTARSATTPLIAGSAAESSRPTLDLASVEFRTVRSVLNKAVINALMALN